MAELGDMQASPGVGADVTDAHGRPAGTVTALAVDADDKVVDWIIITTPDGTRVPLPTFVASVRDDGRVAVPFTRDQLATAPPITSAVLTRELVEALYKHFSLP